MKKSKKMKLRDVKKKPDGSFAGMNFDDESKSAITEYAKNNNIPNMLDPKKLHVTLLYSRKYLPKYKAAGKLDQPYVGKFKGFDIFESSDDDSNKKTNCLVLRFNCPQLSDRHNQLMDEHDATFDYDEYKPHVTLSYDVGTLDPKHLPAFDKDLTMTEEYGTDLDLNWNGKK